MWQQPSSSSEYSNNFDLFYAEVKDIERRDSVLTSEQQINRLLRKGSSYFNLNPFAVLQIPPSQINMPLEKIKKKYKTLSILVHPDKNTDQRDRAKDAFDIVNRSWKILENEVSRKKCMDIYEEAKDRTDMMIAAKRKKNKKDGYPDAPIPEDNPEKYEHTIYVTVMKLFADMERKRQQLDVRDMEERKRKREAEIEQEEALKAEREWQRNFEESRQSRVNSWHDFQSKNKNKKKKKDKGLFNPPKLKPESR
ncbi:dnaJ homolog subfamily C member 8-like [Culicoides brevitarsis]|uniref:dnaJ homolog subfamily C member 8-like n=1 Tax=Culicoides brevitarsis TaxID=469753 RepID=UPI00307B3E9E